VWPGGRVSFEIVDEPVTITCSSFDTPQQRFILVRNKLIRGRRRMHSFNGSSLQVYLSGLVGLAARLDDGTSVIAPLHAWLSRFRHRGQLHTWHPILHQTIRMIEVGSCCHAFDEKTLGQLAGSSLGRNAFFTSDTVKPASWRLR